MQTCAQVHLFDTCAMDTRPARFDSVTSFCHSHGLFLVATCPGNPSASPRILGGARTHLQALHQWYHRHSDRLCLQHLHGGLVHRGITSMATWEAAAGSSVVLPFRGEQVRRVAGNGSLPASITSVLYMLTRTVRMGHVLTLVVPIARCVSQLHAELQGHGGCCTAD